MMQCMNDVFAVADCWGPSIFVFLSALPLEGFFKPAYIANTKTTRSQQQTTYSLIMHFAQPNGPSSAALNMIAEIAQVVTAPTQPRKNRTHKYASARHHVRVQIMDVEEQSDASSAAVDSPATSPSAAITTTSTSVPISTIQAAARAHMSDSRVFEEGMNDMLHAKDGKNTGKLMSDERYAVLVRACGLPVGIRAREETSGIRFG